MTAGKHPSAGAKERSFAAGMRLSAAEGSSSAMGQRPFASEE